jgi:hypothetical protein
VVSERSLHAPKLMGGYNSSMEEVEAIEDATLEEVFEALEV